MGGRGGGIAEVSGQDVRAVQVTATGTAVATPARLKGIDIASAAAGGVITLRDYGAGGTT